MNIQLNLIRPAELRSASMVSLKSLGLIAALVIPLILVLWIGWAYMGYLEVRSELAGIEQERAQSEQQKTEALTLRKTLDTQKELYEDVLGWERARVPWHEVLEGMAGHVPATMQWRSLQMRMQMEIGKDGQLVRINGILLSGRCQGANADVQVEDLRRAWTTAEPAARWVTQAEVSSFLEDDTPGAAKEDRLFEIALKFAPGRFHASAGK